MGNLPFRIDNRPFPDLDNAVASCESRLLRGLNKLHMRPLIPVVVNVISDFGEKHPLAPQYPISLAHECRIGMRKRVAVLLRSTRPETEPGIEVFRSIPSLIRDVRRIINHGVKAVGAKRHHPVVTANRRAILRIDVEADDLAPAVPPKAPAIYRGVENVARRLAGIKQEKPLEQFRVFFAIPNRPKQLVLGSLVKTFGE